MKKQTLAKKKIGESFETKGVNHLREFNKQRMRREKLYLAKSSTEKGNKVGEEEENRRKGKNPTNGNGLPKRNRSIPTGPPK